MIPLKEADAANGQSAETVDNPDAVRPTHQSQETTGTAKDCATAPNGSSSPKGNGPIATFFRYFAVVFALNGACAALTVLLWSNLGAGKYLFDFLSDWPMVTFAAGGVFAGIVVFLYLLDFFCPPHLPGQFFRLWQDDRIVGRSIFCVSVVFLAVAVIFRAKKYPSIPVLVTLVLGPILTATARTVMMARRRESLRKTEIVNNWDINQKMDLLLSIRESEIDALAFYKGSAAAFFLCFAVVLSMWLYFVCSDDKDLSHYVSHKEPTERDQLYVQWATPLIFSISNFVFGLYATLRALMQRAYSYTDSTKNAIIADCLDEANYKDLDQKHRELLRTARNTRVMRLESDPKDREDKRLEYQQASESIHTRRLSLLVKVVGCLFIVLLGMCYVAGQLLYADTHIAALVMFLLGLFFISFIIFVYASFHRVVVALEEWLVHLPLWQEMKKFLQSDWAMAIAFCPLMPLLPVVLILSWLNQRVRRCRGIYSKYQEPDGPSAGGAESFFTPRVQHRLRFLLAADWLSISSKIYILCLIFIVCQISAVIANPPLAWVNKQLADFNFYVILAATFITGVVAFLLPPVPGMTVYIFGGLVVSGNCEPKGSERGFWVGAFVNVALCWFLKLASCAIQQVFIGGLLGRVTWVRQTVGVHKVAIRCIEAVMKKKGLSAGKVAILCGAPDWPVSVLAGVLGLSLFQCELGTVPIIFFVAPCALSGSLYLRKGDSEMWSKSANLMIITALAISLAYNAVAAWAIQIELEENRKELERPLPQNVDLHWLDHRSAEIAKRSSLRWSDIHPVPRTLFVCGAIVHICVAQAMVFSYSTLFGDFRVSDNIDTLVFLGKTSKDGLVTYAALALFVVYFATWGCYVQLGFYRRARTRGTVRAAARELDATEASWKESFLREFGTEDGLLEDVPDESGGPQLDICKFSGNHVTV